MATERKPLPKLLSNPLVTFVLGFSIGAMLIYNVFILLAIAIVAIMGYVGLRDRINLSGGSLWESRDSPTPRAPSNDSVVVFQKRYCPFCGSPTKHKKGCPNYGKGKTE